ncbi:hypothetical protein B0I37DRAFT_20566 [Chaetomium sp. MPI-CAGE-AT-0009]|nr:hypothetical protein B0I37DRAFT_20566 [Chaetomium sp. MPI-CAGE-AT-0009]
MKRTAVGFMLMSSFDILLFWPSIFSFGLAFPLSSFLPSPLPRSRPRLFHSCPERLAVYSLALDEPPCKDNTHFPSFQEESPSIPIQ